MHEGVQDPLSVSILSAEKPLKLILHQLCLSVYSFDDLLKDYIMSILRDVCPNVAQDSQNYLQINKA